MPSLITTTREFSQKVLNDHVAIESWLREQFNTTPPPFYASVDLRRNEHRFAPVDTNLFPAGFNNLSPDALPLLIQAFSTLIDHACPRQGRVLLIPENHTRNLHYWANVWHLSRALRAAGVDIRLGSLDPTITSPRAVHWNLLPVSPADGTSTRDEPPLWVEPLLRDGLNIRLIARPANPDNDNQPALSAFSPCMVVLNNDLSAGYPEILKNLSTPIYPLPELGWHNRKKSTHFYHYAQICADFAQKFGINPLLLQGRFQVIENINFHEADTLKPLAEAVDTLLAAWRPDYSAVGREPYAVIKADAGTYGMSVMSVRSGAEVLSLNRKARNKLAVGKEGLTNHRLMIQEGIHTIESVDGHSAEETLYVVGRHVVGGFYRLHADKDETGILNAPGMEFRAIPFTECCHMPQSCRGIDFECNRLYTSGVIARLATLAAAREAHEIQTLKI